MLSGLMLPIAALACLAAWWALLEALPHCIYCRSSDIQNDPRDGVQGLYECRACGKAFMRVDDAPVGFLEALDAMTRRGELYAD